MKPLVKFKRLPHGMGLPLPAYKTPGAAGADICSAEEVVIFPCQRKLIRTGFLVEIEPGWEIQGRPRSGLANDYGVTIVNAPGTIDSDYRGEIMVNLINHGYEEIHIKWGARIAQLVVAPAYQATFVEVNELTETARGAGGFGSTGTH